MSQSSPFTSYFVNLTKPRLGICTWFLLGLWLMVLSFEHYVVTRDSREVTPPKVFRAHFLRFVGLSEVFIVPALAESFAMLLPYAVHALPPWGLTKCIIVLESTSYN